ncbi:excalibur calcium-binding domain-containing protein [Streptomyces sp. NPDC058613]|uniref:excalibur calcium-binding domain-containing protein n=1 Tax=unclassified Streptomyces TaxID=2593676 RepID=UPI0036617C73
MNPYDPPEPPPRRSGAHRLVRALALILVPPVAAVWLWRSSRLRIVTKVALTAWCVLATLIWIGLFVDPAPRQGDPSEPAETPPAASPSASTPPRTAQPTSPPSPTPPSTTPSPVPPSITAPKTTTAAPSGPPAPTDPVAPAEPSAATTPAEPAEPATEASSAYYRRCADARAAGAAPLYRGQPGYRSGLDRDGDGVACEPWL